MKKVYKILSTKAKAAFQKGTVATLCIMVASLFIMGAGKFGNVKQRFRRRIPYPAIAAIMLILAGSFYACEKENEENKEKEETQLDLGIYVETYPIEKRTHINFISKEKLAIIKESTTDEFYYAINYKENIIELTMIADPSLGGGMVGTCYFKIINKCKCEIAYLYPNAMDARPGKTTIMIFEKENTQNNKI